MNREAVAAFDNLYDRSDFENEGAYHAHLGLWTVAWNQALAYRDGQMEEIRCPTCFALSENCLSCNGTGKLWRKRCD